MISKGKTVPIKLNQCRSTDSGENKHWFFPRLLGDFSYGRSFLPHLGNEHERPTWYWVEVKTRTFTFSARLLREPLLLPPRALDGRESWPLSLLPVLNFRNLAVFKHDLVHRGSGQVLR